ncbi:AaceriABL121Cp [[Ashbya] aceris (nom. inval.)]|nr:AaceriABL121Cp [[Ashbya] aceris (nom. inval.)]
MAGPRKEKDGYGPRIIRTLGSQALGGAGGSSRASSVSQSPGGPEGATGGASPAAAPPSTTGTPLSSLTPTNYRVAQACDRCRSKKTRCDGKRPQCSQCAAVGFECKISDKLSRRAFPRGYTETLEERVRELEAENRRLVALCDLKEEQLRLVSKYGCASAPATSSSSANKKGDSDHTTPEDEQILQQLSNSDGGALRVSSTNLYLLNKKTAAFPLSQPVQQSLSPTQLRSNPYMRATLSPSHVAEADHVTDLRKGLPANPVAISSSVGQVPPYPFTNLNDPTSISFEQDQAPGLPAVKALSSLASHEESSQLAALVAVSIPRTTEEILFVPQLLARIGQMHGFTSKQCLYTASVLASLKEITPRKTSPMLEELKAKNLWEIDDVDTFLLEGLQIDIRGGSSGRVTVENSNGYKLGDEYQQTKDTQSELQELTPLTFQEIEELIQLFFDDWYSLIPIFDRSEFESYWVKFKDNVSAPGFFTSGETLFDRRHKSISYKIFACLLLTVCQMGLMSKVKLEGHGRGDRLNNLMAYYDRAISHVIMNPYFSSSSTSIQSLQLLSLLLFYFLNVGDVSNVYELRGKVVSLTQQLRLHRCPSAVLGSDGSTVSKIQQGERRVLFWGVYYLDVFSSLQLGVPRLLKDHEIECALPVSSDDDNHVNLAGQMIALEGKMSPFSLSIIRFSKVLGNVLDSIFKRGMTESMTKQVALVHENALDNWRHALPDNLRFQLDVNGTINMEDLNQLKRDYLNKDTALKLSNVIFMALYFLAKIMIHLPVVATKPIIDKPQPVVDANTPGSQIDRSSSSYVLLQQATNTFLNVLASVSTLYLPLPLNITRTKTRFGLVSARGSLEYTKGGALFQDNKNLLLDLLKDLETDKKLNMPGTISWHSLKLLDMAVNLILQPPNTKPEKQEKLLQKKINYYNKLIDAHSGPTASLPTPSSQAAPRKSDPVQARPVPEQEKPSSSKRHRGEDNTAAMPHLLEKKVKLEAPASNIPTPPAPISALHEDVPRVLDGHLGANSSLAVLAAKQEPEVSLHSSAVNAITEAFQLDPILQPTPFSNTDLPSFFGVDQYAAPPELQPFPAGYAAPEKAPQAAAQGPSAAAGPPLSSKDGLFKVPSNGDFLKDYYSGMSSAQLNSLFTAPDRRDVRPRVPQPDRAPPDGLQQQPGYGFVVDASLGLAPLLAWSPRPADDLLLDDKDAKLASARSFTHVNKLSSIPTLMSTQPPPASAPPAKLDQPPPPDQDDGILTIPPRDQRGPRRLWNGALNQARPAAALDDSISDLFRWQNSG